MTSQSLETLGGILPAHSSSFCTAADRPVTLGVPQGNDWLRLAITPLRWMRGVTETPIGRRMVSIPKTHK
jgi:hypothetical protein